MTKHQQPYAVTARRTVGALLYALCAFFGPFYDAFAAGATTTVAKKTPASVEEGCADPRAAPLLRIERCASLAADEEAGFDLRAWALRRSALARVAMGAIEAAIADLDAASELDPDQPDYLRLRGSLNRELGRFEAAAIDLRHALELRPGDPSVHREFALTLFASGALDDAIASAGRAGALAKEDARNWRLRSRLRALAGDREGALDDAERAAALDPEDIAARAALGSAQLASGLTEKARANLESAAAGDPSAAAPLAALAWLADDEGDADAARDLARSALARDPERRAFDIWRALAVEARLARAEDDVERALALLREANALAAGALAQEIETFEAIGGEQGGSTTMVASAQVNLRAGPGTDHARIGALRPGDEATVIGESGSWWRIELDGEEAFVAKRYLRAP